MNYLLSFIVLLSTSICFSQSAESGDKDYTVPVLFDFKNSIKQSGYGFSYHLKKDELFFENLGRINESTFSLRLVSLEEAKQISVDAGRGNRFLEVKIPYGFFKQFEIQIINKSGKTILSRAISSNLLEGAGKEKELGQTQKFVVDDFDKELESIVTEKEPVKLCIDQTDSSKMFTRLCSRNFGFVKRKKKYEVKFERKQDFDFRALIDNESAPLKNRVVVPENGMIRAYFEFQGGVVFEMANQPKVVEFIEVTQLDSDYKFIGFGNFPYGATKKEKQSISVLSSLIPFDSTIGDSREFYFFSVPANSTTPNIVVDGQSGGLFQYYLTLDSVPKESDRIYFFNNTPNATYLDKYKLYGTSNRKLTFDSESQVSVRENDNKFEWEAPLAKKGEFNEITLEYEKEGGGKNRAYFEVYRGFSQEFGLKLTGVKTTTQFVTLGEVSYNKWFEDFGTKPGSLVYQRVGIGLNYFKSLSDFSMGGDGEQSSLESQSLALKYRFTSGLWNWDESWGSIFSYQKIKYGTLNTPLAGVGVFWARSMPKVFDRIFNVISVFRYPKWVDVDFVYFPVTLDSEVKTKGSMALNFHGKILWSKKLYGEAGFGYKAFSLSTDFKLSEIRSMYLTLGLGLNF